MSTLVINGTDMMDYNLEEQWIIDRPGDDGEDDWVEWLKFLLADVECEVSYEFYRTYIHFKREEDMTWFILRWS